MVLTPARFIMPNMSGPELARHLQPRYPRMKILFASGYADDALSTRGELDSDIELIQKPFTPRAIVQRIHDLLAVD